MTERKIIAAAKRLHSNSDFAELCLEFRQEQVTLVMNLDPNDHVGIGDTLKRLHAVVALQSYVEQISKEPV